METSENLKPSLIPEDKNLDILLGNIFDNLRQALVIFDLALDIHFFNQVANDYSVKLFGKPLTPGENLGNFITKEKVISFQKIIEKVIKGDEVSTVVKFESPSGELVWFEFSFTSLLIAGEKVNYIVVHGADITQLKTYESKIGETEKRYQAVVQSQSEMICRFTIDGTITFVNNAYCNFFNTTEMESIGSNFFHRVPDILRVKLKDDIMTLTPSKPNNNYVERLVGKDGSNRWISGTNTAMFDNDGNYTEIQTVAKDITMLKNIEQELIREIEHAEESDRLKSNFLTNISHEIRTPLNGILGFISLLKSDKFRKDQLGKYYDLIEDSGKQLLEIIEDMLEVSMIETHQLKFHYTNVYLPDTFKSIEEYVNKSHKKKSKSHIEIKKIIPSSGPRFIKTDGTRLYQVFIKLLNNSFKFTNEGCIEFGYYQSREDIFRFFVRDTGVGIPKDKQQVIFRPFRQAEETPTRSYGGSGLGLTIAKALVESMGGKIYLVSEPGKGSNFYFDLPVLEATKEESVSKKKMTEEKVYNWQDIKILIVEDIQMNFIVLKEFLRDTKAVIIPAKTGNQALDAFKKHPDINIVLLDIRLPDISGYDVAKRIKEKNSKIPIIAETAYTHGSDQVEAYKAGCDSILLKPINREILLETINDFLK